LGADRPVRKTKVVLNSKQRPEARGRQKFPAGPGAWPKDERRTNKPHGEGGGATSGEDGPGPGGGQTRESTGELDRPVIVVAIPTSWWPGQRKRLLLPILASAWYCNSAPFL